MLSVTALLTGCKATSNEQKAPVALTWEMGAKGIEPGYYENTFILKNLSDEPLSEGWAIYYSQLPRNIKQEANAAVKVEAVNGNFFKMSPTASFTPLAPGDSMRITFRCTFGVERNAQAPEGTYWVATAKDGKEGTPLPVALNRLPLPDPEALRIYPDAAKIYEANLRLTDIPLHTYDILPAVKKAVPSQGSVTLEGKVGLVFPEAFAGEAGLLKEKLAGYGLEVADDARPAIVLELLADKKEAVNDEYYNIGIGDGRIRISAATPHGIFNGTQTLLAMLKGQSAPYELDGVEIRDYPDLLYRGQMIDIARDYTTVEDMKKLIDRFAAYKMNVLHFHFCDDEGWRLEIPGLEELTLVGSRRGHTTDESTCLYPGYDGGYDPEAATPGNGYYSRAEFIGLLKYAAARHIRVIPEIETPGHARAAIVSMKARYNKYKDTDPQKATEYLLTDPQDTSKYVSVQSYTDNVIDVALPSAYRFLEKVATEIAAMYKEAGVALPAIHLGGDEVAEGAWMGSPACQALLKEKGWTERRELAEYYITKMSGILHAHGIRSAGWQEVGQGHTPEGHRQMTAELYSVNCWTGSESFDRLYQMANSGYPVVVSSVCNFYMDMTYTGHPDEPAGLDWGGNVDEAVSYSMLPFSIHRALRMNRDGSLRDMTQTPKGGVALTPEGRANIIGVSGQLFSETIRNFGDVEYSLFPKMMGLADRGWNAHPAWEALSGEAEAAAFNRELSRYYEVISRKEMPAWAKEDINFRLPMPGLMVKEGELLANVAIDGAEIRYTTDGTEPTAQSALWQSPVKCDAGAVVKAKTFYQGKESLPITLKK